MITEATKQRFAREVEKYPADQKQSAVMETGLYARGLELRQDLCGRGHCLPSAARRPSTS